MTNQHPITPPPELVQQLRKLPENTSQLRMVSTVTLTTEKLQAIATQAAQWGGDQELEACVQLTWENDGYDAALGLRAARRPKPPSLKEQAKFAAAVLRSPDETCSIAELQQHWHTICNALESLPD